MKRIVLFAALVTGLLTSCSTAYQSAQTPDDLYYSPGPSVDAMARQDREDRYNARKANEEQGEYQEYISSSDDRYLRMKVANRSRWEDIDNYSYWYDSRYDFNNYNYYNSINTFNRWGLYNPFMYSGLYYSFSPFLNSYGYYNPYYGGYGYAGYGGYGGYGYGYGYGSGWSPLYTLIAYGNPKFTGTGTTATSGISAYRNKTYSNTNGNYRVPAANNSFGSLVRRVFTPSNNSSTNSFDRPARTFSPTPGQSQSSAPSSSAGGNSGGFKSTGSTSSTGRGGRG